MTLKKDLTMDDFFVKSYVPWDNIGEVMGRRRYKKFTDWMFGQTSYAEGAYVHDLERYLGTLQGKITYFD